MAHKYEKWEVVDKLAQGGQSATYLVKDSEGGSGQLFVLKRIGKREGRFHREVRALGLFDHPNILKLIDVASPNFSPQYMITEYCSGGSLGESPSRWKGDVSTAIPIFRQLCDGLSYLHSRSATDGIRPIVHRDIKPHNIFIHADGRVVIGDFGICSLDDGNFLTEEFEAVGPRYFIAPELEDSLTANVTTRADVYSAGKVLYWMLRGDGHVFAGQKHRESFWNLTRPNPNTPFGHEDVYMEHVNLLLDLMITEKPDDRRDIDNIEILAKRAQQYVERRAQPLVPNLPRPCMFCGQGQYIWNKTDNPDRLSQHGLATHGYPGGTETVGLFVCNVCSNMQVFHSGTDRKAWWK